MYRFRIRDVMASVIAAAVIFAAPRFWLFLLVWFAFTYAPLALIALAETAVGTLVGGRKVIIPSRPIRIVAVPIGLLFPGADTRSVGLARGVFVTASLAGLWKFWSLGGFWLARAATYAFQEPMSSHALGEFFKVFRRPFNLTYMTSWEAWTLLRWWLIFGVLTLLLAPFSGRHRPWRTGLERLMCFSPWLVVLEIGFLFGAWVAGGEVASVPEPSNLYAGFHVGWRVWLLPISLKFWLLRGGLPTFIAGVAFFRIVGGWRRAAAMAGALALVPPALASSMLWAAIYGLFIE